MYVVYEHLRKRWTHPTESLYYCFTIRTKMNFIYAVLLFYSIGVSSADETISANDVFDKLNLIFSRTMDIEEKLSDYEELKQGINAINEKLKDYEDIKQELDTANEQLALLVKSIDKVESVYDCGWPELAHGHFEGKSTFYRDVLHAVCDEGFAASGHLNATCMPDGKWSVLPKCKQGCQAPPVLNSLEYDTNITYPSDSPIEIHCKLGYRHADSRYMTCDAEYGWQGSDVQCLLVDCGLVPYWENGNYRYNYRHNSNKFNSSVSVICNKGYVRVGQEVIRCDANGSWIGRLACLQRICVDYTTERGARTTECFLKKVNYGFSRDDIEVLGSIEFEDYREPRECIQYCLNNHPSFALVELKHECKCVASILSESPMYYQNNLMYVREGDSSAYTFLTE